MITLRRHPTTLLLNYSVPVLFGLVALLSIPYFTPMWWQVAPLLIAYLVLLFFWPVRQWAVYIYLTAETVLLLALTALFHDFMFLGFTLSAHAAVLLPLRRAFVVTGIYSLGMLSILGISAGWREAIYPGLAPVIGFFAFGYAYNMRERAEEARDNAEKAREEAQTLLGELSEANQKLEASATQVQELAAVEERNRLARELHDSVKQQAFAAAGQLGAARSLLTSNPAAAADHLRKAEALLDEVRQELSQLIHELRPVALQDKGLVSAIREWGTTWSSGCGIRLDLRVQNERGLAPETEQALFRITQEALSNVARHSGASQVKVELTYGSGTVRLSICDDGQGFDPAAFESGFGLHTMRERAEHLKEGVITIESAPGQPTRVIVTCAG